MVRTDAVVTPGIFPESPSNLSASPKRTAERNPDKAIAQRAFELEREALLARPGVSEWAHKLDAFESGVLALFTVIGNRGESFEHSTALFLVSCVFRIVVCIPLGRLISLKTLRSGCCLPGYSAPHP